MGRDPDPQPRPPDRGDVGAVKILLPQMDEIAAELDRLAPVVVDDQRCAMFAAQLAAERDLGHQRGAGPVLDADLDQPHPKGQQPAQPVGAVEHGVKARKPHPSTAMPSIGVEGAAMSRGSIGPAPWASRPASTASAIARAMATGSPARATAVFTSTAS